jgi:RNA polymerase sigma-70 factor (ECF subfamily)
LRDPDASLVAAARAGDPGAFDQLVRRHQGLLRRFIRARLDPAIDADDVAQEVFVAAWRELGRFAGRGQFKTWLFGIALRQCANAARDRQRSALASNGVRDARDGYAAAGDSAHDPDWRAAIEQRATVGQYLVELGETERELLDLYYYAGLNLREIAELLEINLSTLKTRFYQAHRRLRTAMEAREEAVARHQRQEARQ